MNTLVANFVEPRATPPTDMIAPSAGPEAVQGATELAPPSKIKRGSAVTTIIMMMPLHYHLNSSRMTSPMLLPINGDHPVLLLSTTSDSLQNSYLPAMVESGVSSVGPAHLLRFHPKSPLLPWSLFKMRDRV